MTAKRLQSAQILLFPQRARVEVYRTAQQAAALPLEDREQFLELQLAKYLVSMESRYPADIAWAHVKDAEEALRHFMRGMKRNNRKVKSKVEWQTSNRNRGGRTT